jgi:Photosynthetic reaction centre cytochrome C subunit
MDLRTPLITVAVLGVAVSARAQDQLKNVQIFTGMSRPEIWEVMNQMASGLGVNCQYCHVANDVASDAKPQKRRGREMIRMVIDLNARHFGGTPIVTCYTCHNGKSHPALMPPLPQSVPPETKPVEPKVLPTAESVIAKYLGAVGREVAPSTARRFKGTNMSATGAAAQGTVISAGDKTRVDMQLPDGSHLVRVIDSKGGWLRDKDGVRDLTSQQFDAVKESSRAFEPFYTSSIGDDRRVIDSEKIGERSTWVMTTAKARYWFDADSGLLLRRVTYFDSPIGRIPEQTDFDDYRDVGGFKVPFYTRGMLVDPYLGGTRQAESIEIGVPIAPADFEKPTRGENARSLADPGHPIRAQVGLLVVRHRSCSFERRAMGCPACRADMNRSRVRWWERVYAIWTTRRPYRCSRCQRRAWLDVPPQSAPDAGTAPRSH